MFFNSGDLGYQGIKETVDLGFDGSQERFVLHQIEGFGEYPKRRQIYDCKIGVDLDVVRSIEKVYRTLERGDMEDRFHSMRLEGSDLWSKEVKDAGQWYSCFGMEDRGAETRWCQSKKKLDGDLVSYQGYYSSEVA
ncbi:PREDICTED: uncharacterized protein LOC106294201 [Brassica oleracea var. oleracea]|uniref:uncharacterized protein LOC106294201 n=1 Tax=Brassica oleracea var. oleracea TaxID=109376 RepID=UPI0006A6B38C|nr:PREDICTED: uncharacterized protein LOC106294201 [Brassica oleracea var. oleracea]